ncbi:MAG TPA: DUF2505 domain-containing protein, partial [Actinomycetes bacterium]|nr:DUF2505 domain-containing protein [Actinomycetes bacterium]
MSLEHDYPVSPSELFEVMLDPTYLQARQERFGGVGTPGVETLDEDIQITTIRQLPMDKVPGAFKGFVGDGRIVQVDTWHVTKAEAGSAQSLRADWKATLGTAPAKIGGIHTIEATATGSHYEIDVDVSVKVPFVGGKIEAQVRGYLENLIGKE